MRVVGFRYVLANTKVSISCIAFLTTAELKVILLSYLFDSPGGMLRDEGKHNAQHSVFTFLIGRLCF